MISPSITASICHLLMSEICNTRLLVLPYILSVCLCVYIDIGAFHLAAVEANTYMPFSS